MTRLLRTRLADLAEQAIRFGRGNVSRERAAELFADLDIAQPWDEELAELVLARFSPAEPPSVPGLDWLPAVQADAAVLVAEAVAVLDDCTCDLNLRQVCDTCQGVSADRPLVDVPAPVKALPAAKRSVRMGDACGPEHTYRDACQYAAEAKP